jgi:hypothetical protein
MVSMSFSKPFPGFQRLYSMASPGSDRTFIADIELHGADPVAVTRGEQAAHAVTARWAMGSAAPRDIVWTRFVAPVLFSAKLVSKLREGGFSGWSSYPVELTGKKAEGFPGYSGLVVRGRCKPIDFNRSQRTMMEFPAGPSPARKGLFFEERSWDGSDFFMPDDSAWIFVTDGVKDTITAIAKNVRFTPLDEIETPDFGLPARWRESR